jgi:hypothetical protein
MLVRIEFDAERNLVNLMDGNFCIDQMTLDEYRETFGLRAAGALMRGQ